ncbi:MAG: YfhO family protein, partial [Candidatus Omnitrophica bacterium]|nr:YfhO family protein [Candidatus Omnitrophota bacterium]
PNWQVFVDGVKTRIYRANYAFQGIRIAQGKHKVCFRFFTIYPFLMYSHIFCVFLNWCVFNFYLFNIKRENKAYGG